MSKVNFFLILIVFLFACSQTNNNSYIEYSTLDIQNIPFDFSAHWLSADIILLPKRESSEKYLLAKYSQSVSANYETIELALADTPDWVSKLVPHLQDLQAYKTGLSENEAKDWVKYLPFVMSMSELGDTQKITYTQTGFLLDDLYTKGEQDADEEMKLGASINDEGVEFKLWAPTAHAVKVLLFDKNKQPLNPALLEMTEGPNSGVWSVKGDTDLVSAYYQYEITLYHPVSRNLETLVTTDPYSLSLSINSLYSQIVDLSDQSTMPEGWNAHSIPVLSNPEDQILYEVHIGDFSSVDKNLSNNLYRSKYKAFSEKDSDGIKHLKSLHQSGLTTIHLLPAFDIGTVNEDVKSVIHLQDSLEKICRISAESSVCNDDHDLQQTLLELLQSFGPASDHAQAVVSELRTLDNYNWGYDPYHYTVPEGSYALNPEGESRLVEFREMVQSLHDLGFRVVIDVVYNHTHQAGLAEKSVLDKIVPNYYHRLHPVTGEIERSTCCDNTATERKMMAKLMIDSLVVWAREYNIDGFRFDLMGHQPKEVMLAAREAVRKVDPDTYFYGEGWDFGEVANNRQFVQATQMEMAGTEIGTFSDRLRDAVRGCCFNSEGDDIRKQQGIGNGLGVIPNEMQETVSSNSYHLLLDQLRIGLTGNLANFPLLNAQGVQVTGKEIPYGGAPTGYALDPADTINYVSKHDNQTLWDNNQYRNAFDLTTAQRVRMHNQNLSYVLFAQGIPFLHMGSELLRSKSFLRDSYDYGDWFNRVDFSKQNNFYNVGLPPAEKDEVNWSLISRVMEKNQGRDLVAPEDIQFASDVFMEWLQIRNSSPLFRLTNEKDIIEKVSFHNTGEEQIPGLIVMSIKGDESSKGLLVLFNFSADIQSFIFENAENYHLHPVQQNGVDKIVQQSEVSNSKFTVSGLSTTVFVEK